MVEKGMVNLIRDLRSNARRTSRRDLIGVWTEKDRLNGKVVDSLVIILRTRGCYWAQHSGCSMCGYYNDTNPNITGEDIIKQIEYAKTRYAGERLVKIYTSGSFLDDREVPAKVQVYIIESFADADRIIIETRPEFVTDEKLKFIKDYGNVMIALGLESANNETLLLRINKGFTVEQYVKAAEDLISYDIPVKTYVLLKPPFMTERMAIEEAVQSIIFASKYSEVISLNPMNIQSNTLVEYLWKRGEYRAPWLWSVVEVLKRTAGIGKDVISYPTAGGTKRGAHNCGKCDKKVLEAIYDFSLTQNSSKLNGVSCECRERWKKLIEYEDYLWDFSVNF